MSKHVNRSTGSLRATSLGTMVSAESGHSGAVPAFSLSEWKHRFLNSVDHMIYRPVLERRAKRLTETLLPSLERCESLLDFGCGNMVLTEQLHRQTGVQVTGVDMVDNNLSDLPLMLYDGKELPFDDNSFDSALAVFSLHHCENPEFAFSELVRVSRQRVILIEETYTSLLERNLLHLHDWIGNHLESWNVNIPFNFRTEQEWERTFRMNNLNLTWKCPVFQYSRMNLTRQVLFECKKR